MPSDGPALRDWRVELLRLTAFLSAPVEDVSQIWQSLAGEEPRSSSHRRLPTGELTVFEEQFENYFRSLRIEGGAKIDWMVTGLPQLEPPQAVPYLGRLDDMWEHFVDMADDFALTVVAPLRLAAACVILHPVRSQIDGNRLLQEFLPEVRIDACETLDFIYRINRRRQLEALPDLSINRVNEWSVVVVEDHAVQLGGPAPKMEQIGSSYYVRTSIDVNTVPDGRLFDPDDLRVAMKELVRQMLELVTEGDRP